MDLYEPSHLRLIAHIKQDLRVPSKSSSTLLIREQLLAFIQKQALQNALLKQKLQNQHLHIDLAAQIDAETTRALNIDRDLSQLKYHEAAIRHKISFFTDSLQKLKTQIKEAKAKSTEDGEKTVPRIRSQATLAQRPNPQVEQALDELWGRFRDLNST